MGLALRALGRGAKVRLAQFMKTSASGELTALANFPGWPLFRCEEKQGFSFSLDPEGRERMKEANRHLLEKAIAAADCDLLILDEALIAYHLDYIDRQALLQFIVEKPAGLELVLTGRNAAPELIALADYVSEIKKVKHPFDRRIHARIGIEK